MHIHGLGFWKQNHDVTLAPRNFSLIWQKMNIFFKNTAGFFLNKIMCVHAYIIIFQIHLSLFHKSMLINIAIHNPILSYGPSVQIIVIPWIGSLWLSSVSKYRRSAAIVHASTMALIGNRVSVDQRTPIYVQTIVRHAQS